MQKMMTFVVNAEEKEYHRLRLKAVATAQANIYSAEVQHHVR